MPKVELKYLGDDLVISKQTAEQELGLHPGDRVEIRPKADFGPEVQSFEKSRLLTDSLENSEQLSNPRIWTIGRLKEINCGQNGNFPPDC